MKLKYLIVSCGRSGSVWAARFLTGLGIPCGHESIFDWRGLRGAMKKLSGEEIPDLSYASQTRWENGNWQPLEKWLDVNSIEAESSYMAVPYLKEDILKDVKI